MTERAFRYRLDPQHNTSFGLAILQAIAASPADDVLRRNLVLKGGAALLLVYGSGRATRHDLDFDVLSDTEIGRQPLLALLARLRSPWSAQIKAGAPQDGFEIFDDALNVGPIEFRHQRQALIRGELTLQISRRKVPPYLAELIRPFKLRGPDGQSFQSPIASLEVIASEKLFRSVSKKGPYVNDFYDIGYVLSRGLDEVNTQVTFRLICREEAYKLARDQNDRAIRDIADAVRRATNLEAIFRDPRVVDRQVTLEVARQRALSGVAWTRDLAGLPPIKGVRREL